jgi:hypothetical protein
MVERDGSLRPFPQTIAGTHMGFHLEMDKHVEWQNGRTAIGLGDDADRLAAGWPCLALECGIVYNTHNPPDGRLRKAVQIGWNSTGGPWLLDGVSLYEWKWLHAKPWRFLPLRPRVAGFAADTLLTGGLLWFAAFGWRDVRRLARAKAGRCVTCGYPVKGLGRCPECGDSVLTRLIRRLRGGAGAAPSGLLAWAIAHPGLPPRAKFWRRSAAGESGAGGQLNGGRA